MAKKYYDHQEIENKWQKIWHENNLFQDTAKGEVKNPLYLLFAFAYPSGSGLHVGHVESKTALDILARFNRMNGRDVFFPVGWDAFGLPAENYAIKTGVPPEETTKKAIATFGEQLKRIAISYDWANELATCYPDYYRWTQWIFLQLYQEGLAYQAMGKVNWCPQDQTVLANEQVVNGECERCGAEVVQKDMKQWYFKITDYRDELISGLDQVDWPHATKQQQLNWIGKSKGLSIEFTHEESKKVITVWTKFWETVFGVTFLVVSPEKFVEWKMQKLVDEKHTQSVLEYLEKAKSKTEEERKIGKDKTGVDTGITVTNPVDGSQVPVFIADYVLEGVGTGAVMGVPAHDERDFEFAQKFSLPVKQVVTYEDKDLDEKVATGQKPHEGEGKLLNSEQFDGLDAWGEGKKKMAEWMIEQGFANWETSYKLRDWLISRQRYWGAPIPIVYDPEGMPHPVKEEHLPWMLPADVDFKPTGESPLRSSVEFKKRVEELYGEGWTPEYDTMDTFVDSSWYFLRYVDAHNSNEFASEEQLNKWLPVDFYMIGPEHIVLHLLYARFFTKFLRDQGYLNFDEPFIKMRHQGMILGPDGKKMSKSKGNVINPDDVVEKFGADTLRVYEMFMGPIESDKPWDERSVIGVHKFLRRIYDLVLSEVAKEDQDLEPGNEVMVSLHQTIKKVSEDIPELKFNTAIASLMKFINVWALYQNKGRVLSDLDVMSFIKLLAPFSPFVAEELWHNVNKNVTDDDTIHQSEWPSFDKEMAKENNLVLPIQVNGKVRDQLSVSTSELESMSKENILSRAKEQENAKKWLQGKDIKKEIYVPGKIINFVV